ncbi:MAG: hypothetical protein DRG78_06215 [Epsilonproteobacteria bacterium]|nr:MAG: hypothetical protein DRG78_06215 [Campylobacterota bacterium]
MEHQKILKSGVVLAINTQEELNQLAEVTKSFSLDSIVIKEDMFAVADEIGAVVVLPMSDYDSRYNKPRLFKTWIRSVSK